MSLPSLVNISMKTTTSPPPKLIKNTTGDSEKSIPSLPQEIWYKIMDYLKDETTEYDYMQFLCREMRASQLWHFYNSTDSWEVACKQLKIDEYKMSDETWRKLFFDYCKNFKNGKLFFHELTFGEKPEMPHGPFLNDYIPPQIWSFPETDYSTKTCERNFFFMLRGAFVKLHSEQEIFLQPRHYNISKGINECRKFLNYIELGMPEEGFEIYFLETDLNFDPSDEERRIEYQDLRTSYVIGFSAQVAFAIDQHTSCFSPENPNFDVFTSLLLSQDALKPWRNNMSFF